MPRTEPGKWLLEEYARTPGDPKWYPGRGLESTIEAIETYSGFWECDSCGRRVEAATPAPQPDALSAEGIIGRGMDLRQFAPDRNRLISLLLTIDGAAGGNRRLSASWAFEMADELLAAGVALAATPAPLDVHPGHVCFDHARYDGLRDWWDGLDDAEKREAYLVEKGNADALALAPSLLDVSRLAEAIASTEWDWRGSGSSEFMARVIAAAYAEETE